MRVEVEYNDLQRLTFKNVTHVSEAKNNLILYFRDGSKQKISNDVWYSYETFDY